MSIFLPHAPVAEINGVYYAFIHSDGVGQAIVVGLLILSMITWTIMLCKGLGLKQAYCDSRKLIDEFRQKRNPFQLRERMKAANCPVSAIFASAYNRVAQLHNGQTEVPVAGRRILNDSEVQIIRASMEETVADQIVALEDKLIFLMTAVSISPFLGLFGTVWGIMLAFTAMAIQGKPDVATLAPGVSGALLTTVLGLLVAIPSLIGYNMISFYIKQITIHMDNFVEEFVSKLKMEQLEEAAQKQALEAAPVRPAVPVAPSYQPPAPQPVYQQPVQQPVYQQQVPQPVYQQSAPPQASQPVYPPPMSQPVYPPPSGNDLR